MNDATSFSPLNYLKKKNGSEGKQEEEALWLGLGLVFRTLQNLQQTK